MGRAIVREPQAFLMDEPLSNLDAKLWVSMRASADEDEATAALADGKSLWIARVSKESKVKHGGPLELSVDTRYLQFFDPASGLSIGHPKATAALGA